MKYLADEIADRLEDFSDQLRRGERIMVSTVERCGCHEDPKCGLCQGRGYLFGAKTLWPTHPERPER